MSKGIPIRGFTTVDNNSAGVFFYLFIWIYVLFVDVVTSSLVIMIIKTCIDFGIVNCYS